jgi:hypothetical protein
LCGELSRSGGIRAVPRRLHRPGRTAIKARKPAPPKFERGPSPGMHAPMEDMKLLALDPEDLRVISCHLQDAVMRVEEMAYLKGEMRFAAILNRFDWEQAAKANDATYRRRRAALRFERVMGAQVSGIDLKQKDAILSLLAIGFDPAEEPSGTVILLFAGGGAIRLQVECIEAELRDLGAAWRTHLKPEHAGDDIEQSS